MDDTPPQSSSPLSELSDYNEDAHSPKAWSRYSDSDEENDFTDDQMVSSSLKFSPSIVEKQSENVRRVRSMLANYINQRVPDAKVSGNDTGAPGLKIRGIVVVGKSQRARVLCGPSRSWPRSWGTNDGEVEDILQSGEY